MHTYLSKGRQIKDGDMLPAGLHFLPDSGRDPLRKVPLGIFLHQDGFVGALAALMSIISVPIVFGHTNVLILVYDRTGLNQARLENSARKLG